MLPYSSIARVSVNSQPLAKSSFICCSSRLSFGAVKTFAFNFLAFYSVSFYNQILWFLDRSLIRLDGHLSTSRNPPPL